MDILGIGMPEIILILLLVVIIFGPKDLETMGKKIGSAIFRFIKSDTYQDLRRIGNLPREFLRQSGLDEARASINSAKITVPTPQDPPASAQPEQTGSENRIEPPVPGGDGSAK
jgi:Sec-independent protein translocase protein TatA